MEKIIKKLSYIHDEYLVHQPNTGKASGGLFVTQAQSKVQGYEKASDWSRAGHAILGILKGTIAIGGFAAAVFYLGPLVAAKAVPGVITTIAKYMAAFGIVSAGLAFSGVTGKLYKLVSEPPEGKKRDGLQKFAYSAGTVIGAPATVFTKLIESAYSDLSLAKTGHARNLGADFKKAMLP